MDDNGPWRSAEQKEVLMAHVKRHGMTVADAERMARCTNAAIDRIKFLMEQEQAKKARIA